MKNKQFFCLLLTFVMLLALTACAANADAKAETTAQPQSQAQPAAATPTATPAETAAASTVLSDIDAQLVLIHSQIDKLVQKESGQPWYYAVTDLDHDGALEFVAASQHPKDRSTNLKVWIVNADRNALTECKIQKDEEESFPDIMTDSADTYHVNASNTWYYTFYDNVVISDTEVYTSKSAFDLKNGTIGYEAYAVEHSVVENGKRTTTHTDMNGAAITHEQYNTAGVSAFANAEKSNTSFEWLTADKTKELRELTDSFLVFMGMKKPTEKFPVPTPAALQAPEATPAPSPTPAPTPAPAYLTITKNPTNENRKTGDAAIFIAGANNYDRVTWTAVAPYGSEFTTQQFATYFPGCSLYGEGGTTFSIGIVSQAMDGWGFYCTFFYQGQTARTSTAYVYVSNPTPPGPSSGTDYGSVADWTYSTIRFDVNGGTVTLSRDICDISGNLSVGSSATMYWNGYNGSQKRYTYVSVQGDQPVGPIYGSMSGSAHEGGGGYSIDLDNGSQVYVDAWKCNVSGTFYDGCSCTVYYQNWPSAENISSVDIYGSDDPGPIGPIYGNMSGTLTGVGGRYSISLSNGSSVTVDDSVCSLVSGDYAEVGNSCTVYYQNWPSAGNIYEVDIYGSSDPSPWVGPIYGSMSGSAHEGGGGYAIDLDNGTQVFVDSWNCNVHGSFYDGCPATVYYQNYPSNENISSADIYGDDSGSDGPYYTGLIVPDDDDDFQGGWAGSQYYNS